MDNLTWWHVYLFTRLDVLNSISILGLVLTNISLAAAVVIAAYNNDMRDIYRVDSYSYKSHTNILKWCVSYLKIGGIAAVLFLITFTLVPTQKEAAAIYLLPKLVNSSAMKEAEKLPETLVKLLDAKMKAWISDSVEEQTTNVKEIK